MSERISDGAGEVVEFSEVDLGGAAARKNKPWTAIITNKISAIHIAGQTLQPPPMSHDMIDIPFKSHESNQRLQILDLEKSYVMTNLMKMKSWSPYVVGTGIGILSWFTFLTAGNALGISTAFESSAAIAERQLVQEVAAQNPFFEKKSPKIDWGWMLVAGVFIGALLSSKLSGDRDANSVPPLWADRFGSSTVIRMVGAFSGGLLMMLGARLAGGCTSGHGISGSLQLAVSSWLFVAIAFPAGIATAFLLFARKKPSHV